MAGDKKLPVTVVIGAVDNLTYKVMAINEKLKKITGPANNFKSALSAFGEESGLSKLSEKFGKVASTGRTFVSDLTNAITKISATALAAGGALFGIVKSFSDSGDDISATAARLGLTTKAYQELAFAANQANVPQELFNSSMQKFSKGIGEAYAGTGQALEGFIALGISVRDGTGKLKSLESLLPEVADKLKGVQNQNIRNAVAARLFGKEGAKLNEIFADGSEGLAKMRAEAERVGAVMSEDQIKSAKEFDSGLKSITATLLMVRNVIGAALAPVLLKFGKIIQDTILSHKDEIKAFAAEFAEKLPGAIEQVIGVFSALRTILSPVFFAFKVLGSLFGEVNLAAIALFTYFAGPAIASLFSFTAALFGFNTTLALTAYRLASLAFAEVIGSINGFMIAIQSGAGVMEAFNLVLAANPIGLVIVGITTLAGLGVILYKNWKPFADLVDRAWATLKGVFGFGKDTNINGTLTTLAVPALGPAQGFSKTVDAAQRASSQKYESNINVAFSNMPRGTRVESSSTDPLMDLFQGFSMVGL